MADDYVEVPVVSTKKIAVDDVDDVEYQLVKLVDGTEDSIARTGVPDNPMTVDARVAFVDFDDSIVPVTDNDDNHWLPVAVRNQVDVSLTSATADVRAVNAGTSSGLTGPSDGTWGTDIGLNDRFGALMLNVATVGGTPTVAVFGASRDTFGGGTYDQQLPLVVPDGDSLVLADTFTPGAGARFCYILASPLFAEVRAVSGGTSDPVEAELISSSFPTSLMAALSSGGASGDTELTTKDYDSGGGTDTQAVVGILLPKSGGAVAGGTSTDPLRTDPTGTTAQPVTDNGGSLTVDGTVAATQSGAWDVSTVSTVTNVVHVDDNSSTLSVDDGGGSLTVDAASLPLPTGASTAAKQPALGTAGSASTDVITVQGIASGTVIPVSDGGGSLTVDGTVTANAGTNLNTSALATESGGNLAAAATSLGVIDDWDESDRAKVNPIVGQAGVQGASGTVSATTQRVVLATDVALPAGSNAIGKLAANSGVDIGDVDVTSVSGTVTVGGVAATDAAVSGNPVLAAGRASTAIPTAMSADGDVVPVWLDRNGAMVTTPRFGATSTLANVAASATNVTLIAANTSRRSATIVNDSTSLLMVKEGATASATSFTWLLQAYDTLVLDGQYSGIIDGIWATATGNARVTERT